MARQVYIPGAAPVSNAKGDALSKLMTIGGAVAGGMLIPGAGAPLGATIGGAMTGAQAGGMLGSMGQKAAPQKQEIAPLEGGAMDRRMSQLQNSDLSQLRNSIDSLQYVQDNSLREQLAKPLLQAEFMAKKKGGPGGSIG